MANNSVPYEIIAASATVWWAPVGTAFPVIDAVPIAPWARIGTAGDLNYLEEGVKISHSQETEDFMALGDSGVRKVFRKSEELSIAVTVADLTLEQYAHALNSNSVTTVAAGAGTAGYKKIGLSRGFSVATVALVVRFPSPYGENFNFQYQIPRAAQKGSPEIVMHKGEPAALALEWMGLVDPNAANEFERFGTIVAQNADPV